MKNTNYNFGASSTYDNTQNMQNNYISNNNHPETENKKKKNILAAIDINSSFNNKKRPYSANKPLFNNDLSQHNNLYNNKNRPEKKKDKVHDNLDLANYQNYKNINSNFYQNQIDKIVKEYGNIADIDENLLREYIENLNSENIINRQNNNTDLNLEMNMKKDNYNKTYDDNTNVKISREREKNITSDKVKKGKLFVEEEAICGEENNFHLYNLQHNQKDKLGGQHGYVQDDIVINQENDENLEDNYENDNNENTV